MKEANSKTHVETNSIYPMLERVFDALKKLEKENDIAYFAKIISEKARVKFSTARGALRKLLRQKRVFQQYPRSPYSSKPFNIPRSGVAEHIQAYRVCLPRVQDLVLVAVGLSVPRGLPDLVYSVGDVEFKVVFGWKRGKVSAVIRCDDGLSCRELRFVVRDFKRRVGDVLGCVPEFNVDATRYEFLKDYLGVRLEGLKAITLTSFMGLMEKLYQKEKCLRHEVRSHVPVPVETLQGLMQGGMSTANLQQFNYLLVKDVARILEEMKRQGQETRFLVPTMKGFYDAAMRILDRQDLMEKQHATSNPSKLGEYADSGYHLRR